MHTDFTTPAPQDNPNAESQRPPRYLLRASHEQAEDIRRTLHHQGLTAEDKDHLVAQLSNRHRLYPVYVARIANGLANPPNTTTPTAPRPSKQKRLPNNRNKLRQTLGESQEWRCAYCLTSIRDTSTIDHIIPFAKGGLRTHHNLQLVCKRCNNAKATMSDQEFRSTTNRRQKLNHILKPSTPNRTRAQPFRFEHCSCTIHGCYPGCPGCELCTHYFNKNPHRPACPNGPTPPYPCPTPDTCQAANACTSPDRLVH